jgi:alpha-tubulin suppressor-like RCC1 family protein
MQETLEHMQSSRRLISWGLHSDGQAGIGAMTQGSNAIAPQFVPGIEGEITFVSSGFRHTLVLAGGRVYVFGFSRHGRLGLLETKAMEKLSSPTLLPFPIVVTSVAAGFGHSAAVDQVFF